MTRLALLAAAAVAVLVAVGGPTLDTAKPAGPRSSCCSTRRRSHTRRAARSRSRPSSVPSARELAAAVPEARDRLALPARRERLLRDAARARGAAARAAPAASATCCAPELRAAARRLAAADRRARALGRRARHGRSGSEDRDHRLRHRPDAPVLRRRSATRCRGLPEGPARFTTAKVIVARVFAPERDRGERAGGLRRGRLQPRHARRRHRSRERGHAGGGPADLRRRAARVPRQLQGLRRDRLGPEPERQRAGDRRGDRGRRRRRDGRHQLLGRRAGDRAEPRHRRARARRRRSGRASCRSSRPGTTTADVGAGSVSSPANSARAISVGAVEIAGSPAVADTRSSRRSGRPRSRSG